MIIEAFQEYFSIPSFGGKHQKSFYNVLVKLHKLYKLCVTHGHDKNCIPDSQKFLSFSHPNSI